MQDLIRAVGVAGTFPAPNTGKNKIKNVMSTMTIWHVSKIQLTKMTFLLDSISVFRLFQPCLHAQPQKVVIVFV